GDTLVLCSDGLSGQVSRHEIADVVHRESDLATVCTQLIDMANSAGGPDNITVIAARFDGDGLESAMASDEVGHRVFPVDDSGSAAPGAAGRLADDDPSRQITAPVHAVRPESLTLPLPLPVPRPAAGDDGAPMVSEERRARGRAIQRLLLVTLVVAAGLAVVWWFGRMMHHG
ncbi:MAG: hypothetical protein ACREN3_14450, partial [Gemmatimonadaceae bacterium]